MVIDIGTHWIPITKFDSRAVGLYQRHYSSRVNVPVSRWRHKGILGPGESLTLLTIDSKALFAWRYGIDHCIPSQTGVNCAIFRNEGHILSSELIIEADKLAWDRWPDQLRHYTYINTKKIKSTNQGLFLNGRLGKMRVYKGQFINFRDI